MLSPYKINAMKDAGVRTVRVGDDYFVDATQALTIEQLRVCQNIGVRVLRRDTYGNWCDVPILRGGSFNCMPDDYRVDPAWTRRPVTPTPEEKQDARVPALEQQVVELERKLADCRTMLAYRDGLRSAPLPPFAAIGRLVDDAIGHAVSNGAGSRSVPDYAVEVASWLLRSAWQTPASCAVLEGE